MRQSSFSELEYAGKKKLTRRDRFLAELEAVTPWPKLLAVREPHYPEGEGRGRPPIGLSDEGLEDAVYDSQAIRRFIGIHLNLDAAPDATSLLKFRRLLETHKPTQVVFDTINAHLAEKGLLLREGTIVEATIIAAPSSTKNRSGQRDADTHQTKKGKTWHFGMEAHIGVDADSGLVHKVVTTAANTNDVTQAHALLHGEARHAFGDAGYTGVTKRDEHQGSTVTWHVAMKPGKRRLLPATPLGQLFEKIEQAKVSVRAKVEHAFHVVKNLFKHRKTRYRGLATMKNAGNLLKAHATYLGLDWSIYFLCCNSISWRNQCLKPKPT